ncbi:AAA family ATPase [Lacticaseibacillus zeae]|uniref:AAA family ATPase n=1 Tax=Lacticaseibacillus zeae subsp. silagei TaxID=3068307 RepID=A0ABD7Z9C2_LACZE|nr:MULTISPECIES: AAA family ATPase [Lacticaseibacillus]MDE3316756.1 AAA family ATPase [Lacticaseibacillus zeae]OFR95924.1 ABC transporter ATP-binding protein [Lactobacillus sp. HMSC068F07]WLV83549.1 AAA family ATPase [Lacticaseibacillus sp. NCIMB 15475]WLV86298.1 AAA family ATPase [Lacticaseibacillus sp. NCIMB 15474]
MLLNKIQYTPPLQATSYPFNLPWQAHFRELKLTQSVTILTGDNGSGKSTLLNAIAANYNAILMSGASLEDGPEYDNSRALARQLKLTWTYRTKSGFLFRADDFISFIRATRGRIKYAQAQLEHLAPKSLERLPYLNTLAEVHHLYKVDLDTLSHGQAFLALFRARLHANALYLLDEPESPLTPENQLSLLALIHEAVTSGAQFIISTHSPILMAYPDAQLLALGNTLAPIQYDQIEHITFLRSFLDDPQRFVYHLLHD